MNNNHHSEQNATRCDDRFSFSYPWKSVNLKPLGEAATADLNGLMIDHSSSGIGVLSVSAFKVGTKVVIHMPDDYEVIGVVKNVEPPTGEWEASGFMRMGIELINRFSTGSK